MFCMFIAPCSHILLMFSVVPQESQMVGEESSEQDILRSNLWTSLFRGGYMVGKLERTLSGKFVSKCVSKVAPIKSRN